MPPASRTGPSEEGRLDDGLRGILPFAPYSMTQLPVSRENDETCALHFGEGSDIKPGEKTRQCAGM